MRERHVSIFGGGSSPTGSFGYLVAKEAGKLLAQAGWTVVTGAYGGIMAGANEGVNEVGGRIIGFHLGSLVSEPPVGSFTELVDCSMGPEEILTAEEADGLRLGQLLSSERFLWVIDSYAGSGTMTELSRYISARQSYWKTKRYGSILYPGLPGEDLAQIVRGAFGPKYRKQVPSDLGGLNQWLEANFAGLFIYHGEEDPDYKSAVQWLLVN